MIRKILTIFTALYLSIGFAEAQTFPIQNLNLLGQFQISGSPGTAGFVLQSNGAASPSWAPATGNSVANTAALQTLASTSATQIWRLGVNTVGDAAPLLFKSSNSACSLNSGNGDTGSQVKSSDSKCWLAVYPSGPIDAAEFGLDITGATDSTTQLQAAWNYAGVVGQNLKLPATSPSGYIKFSTITMPIPTGYFSGASALVGDYGNTVLKSTVTGTTCAINIAAPAASPNFGGTGWGGWALWSLNNAGYGLCLNTISHFSSEPLSVINFAIQIYALDTLTLTMNRPLLENGQHAIYANKNVLTNPNDWNINGAYVSGQTADGLLIFAPSDFNIRGGDFEGINVANTSGFCAINVQGNDGTKGLSVFGGYFELNGGTGDICIEQPASGVGSGPGMHSIVGANFDRISNSTYTTNNVVLVNANAGATTTISMHGNSFNDFNTYVPNASRPFWGVSSPGTANYKLTDYGDNKFGNTTEAPGNCFAAGVAACINLPDGHIEEWGTATTGSGTNGSVTVTYPLACPTAADSFSAWNANGGSPVATAAGTVTATSGVIIAATGPITVGWRLLCH